MHWLNNLLEAAIARQPEGEILVSSGASPSGTYHFGHLRELITCDAIVRALEKRGRKARHMHFVDDLDALRKVPVNIPESYEQYLGMPLCDIPAPDGSERSYANYFLDPFIDSVRKIGLNVDVEYSHQKYRDGFFVPAIERSLSSIPQAKQALELISGRKLDEHWTPIQIMERNRLKNRKFVSMNTKNKTIQYIDSEGVEQVAHYDNGEVKLDWRLDWPGRWWQLKVQIEPFGQDHASKGGSYDTGVEIMKRVYEGDAPLPVPYEFVNRTGDTKKMSASKGTGISAEEVTLVLPAEVVRFFMLRYPPSKRLYFDQHEGVMRLIDEYAQLRAKQDPTNEESEILFLCSDGIEQPAVSKVPFSLLVASYQASLNDIDTTLEVIKRTEYKDVVEAEPEIVKNELHFIAEWLNIWAPEDVKFSIKPSINAQEFTDDERTFLAALATVITDAPADADGAWFHNAIYAFKETGGLPPQQMFAALYKALIGKTSGPRAGWFLAILPREWLIERLKLNG